MPADLTLVVKVLNKAKAGFGKVLKSLGSFSKRAKSISKGMAIGIAGSFVAVTAAIVGAAYAFKKAIKEMTKYGDTVDKMSKRVGFGVVPLQEWQHVLEITGSDLGSFEKAIKSMARTIYDAGRGTVTAVDALAKLGIAYEDIVDLSPEQQFEKLVKALADIENQTLQSGLAQEVFKRAGFGLLPMLRSSSKEISKLRKEVGDLGIALSEADVSAAAEATDEFTRMGKIMKAVRMKMSAAFLPLIIKITNGFIKMWATFVKAGGLDKLVAKVQVLVEKIEQKIAPLKGILDSMFSGSSDAFKAGFSDIKSWMYDELLAPLLDIARKFGDAVGDAITERMGEALDRLDPIRGKKKGEEWDKIREAEKLSDSQDKEIRRLKRDIAAKQRAARKEKEASQKKNGRSTASPINLSDIAKKQKEIDRSAVSSPSKMGEKLAQSMKEQIKDVPAAIEIKPIQSDIVQKQLLNNPVEDVQNTTGPTLQLLQENNRLLLQQILATENLTASQ